MWFLLLGCHSFQVLSADRWELEMCSYIRACVLSSFSRVWLRDPMNCGPPGSSVHGILQARTLEWVVMPSSRQSTWHRDGTLIFLGPALQRIHYCWDTGNVHIYILTHIYIPHNCPSFSTKFLDSGWWKLKLYISNYGNYYSCLKLVIALPTEANCLIS